MLKNSKLVERELLDQNLKTEVSELIVQLDRVLFQIQQTGMVQFPDKIEMERFNRLYKEIEAIKLLTKSSFEKFGLI